MSAKALTLRQPYASLVAVGAKRIETRSFRTSYRGELLIHAGKRQDDDALRVYGAGSNPIRWTLGLEPSFARVTTLPLGAVVASCTLADCVPILAYDAAVNDDLADLPYPRIETIVGPSWNDDGELLMFHDVYGDPGGRDDGRLIIDQAAFGDFSPGRWAWLLEDIKSVQERCPRCWDEGTIEREGGGREWCPTCDVPARQVAPVPMRGRQGLFDPTWPA